MNHEKKSILSVGADGTMFVYKVDLEAIQRITRGEIIEEFQFEEFVGGISDNAFTDEVELSNPEESEILDDTVRQLISNRDN